MITERFAENNRLKRYAYDLIRKVFYKKVTHSFVASPKISLFYSSNPKRMKQKFLLASAVAIVGIAVYTLTLSFTHSAPLLSQLEALADGEGGESGGGTENENPESGDGQMKYKRILPTYHCQILRWEKVSDGGGGHNWVLVAIGDGPSSVVATVCLQGKGEDYALNSCTPYDPCNPAKPTE